MQPSGFRLTPAVMACQTTMTPTSSPPGCLNVLCCCLSFAAAVSLARTVLSSLMHSGGCTVVSAVAHGSGCSCLQVPHGRSLWAPQQADPHAFGGFGPPAPAMAAPMMRMMRSRAAAPVMKKGGGGGERTVLPPPNTPS